MLDYGGVSLGLVSCPWTGPKFSILDVSGNVSNDMVVEMDFLRTTGAVLDE
jgi:hypothetical protein